MLRIVVIVSRALYALVGLTNFVLLPLFIGDLLFREPEETAPMVEFVASPESFYWAGWMTTAYIAAYTAVLLEGLSRRFKSIPEVLASDVVLFAMGIGQWLIFTTHLHPKWQFLIGGVTIPMILGYLGARVRDALI